ncbi:MAG: RdgB/HAM1 family non-canonical purine NTP pyrophosphatase [Alphaproteobacteria bacterium]|nr:RdgB/HAM1 family non-canonical purine NTP pyrophosphatase [Alphaproteobacteria bacterium]
MARLFNEPELIIATHNPGKLREIAQLFEPFGVQALSAGELGLPEPMEDGLTFIANAEVKARAAVEGSDKPAVSDDSGLVVPALGGDPGIYSARWAGPGKNFNVAMKRVQDELGNKDRRAYFVAALALAWPDGHIEMFEGTVHGTLVWPPRGDLGFGYDPMFQPNGYDITFGEFEPSAKHAISHRADAFNQLVAACFAR